MCPAAPVAEFKYLELRCFFAEQAVFAGRKQTREKSSYEGERSEDAACVEKTD
jgi:hypothetical protein